MGTGNNIGIKASNTDYVLILNPDVLLEKNTLEELFEASKKLKEFSILAPLEKNFINYGFFNKKKINKNLETSPFQVDFVDGFAMLINKKNFKEVNYFDENFFMYLENNDLCKRSRDKGNLIYVVPRSKINHLAAKTVDKKYEDEVEFSRNWHWIWSKFYFNKKHYGLLRACYEGFPRFCTSLTKFLFYLLINNKKKKKIYFNRASGFFNIILGKSSWYRPNPGEECPGKSSRLKHL
jgi:Predicted glycosyltransferases